jgi:hypothetical protein
MSLAKKIIIKSCSLTEKIGDEITIVSRYIDTSKEGNIIISAGFQYEGNKVDTVHVKNGKKLPKRKSFL